MNNGRRNSFSRKNRRPASPWSRQEIEERYPRCDLTCAPILGWLLKSPAERIETARRRK